jgi:broad specificity phosphatase PhoE
MELFLIRHGQSTNNALGLDIVNRVPDAPLTELGHRQAARVAEYLASAVHPEFVASHHTESAKLEERRGYGITRLYCSAMHRALQTAQPIGRALGIAPQVWVAIHEHGGIYLDDWATGRKIGHPGLTSAEVRALFEDYILPDDLTDKGWWDRDFETASMAQGRAIVVAEQLRSWAQPNGTPLDYSNERIGVVSHGTFLDMLLKALFNQLPGSHVFYHHYNTAITHIEFRPDGILEVNFMNRTDHLPTDMISA